MKAVTSLQVYAATGNSPRRRKSRPPRKYL